MKKFMVERTFPSPVTDADLAAVNERIGGCLDLYDVAWKRSYCSEDRMRMICEFEARDAESVRKVQREAGASFDRVWPADLLT